MPLKAEDITFWILMLAAIAIIIWMLIGSPTLESGILTIGLFIISSEFMLWKNYFKINKNTAVSFTRLKNDIDSMNNKLDNIKNLIKK